MTLDRVKFNMNQPVIYNDHVYTLTGCILRMNKSGEFYYQVELCDTVVPSSIVIARLNDITEKQ